VQWLDFNSAEPLTPTHAPPSFSPRYDTNEVRQKLLGSLESVLGYLYPAGFADPKGRTFYIGNTRGDPGESLNVSLGGERAGNWFDFATGEGGDIFHLWREARGLPNFSETLRDAAEYTGAAATVPRQLPTRRKPSSKVGLGLPSATYRYHDADGGLLAEVDRFDLPEGKKVFRPWSVVDHKHTAPDPRPLYNLPNVIKAPEVVLVEGEKCAEALMQYGLDATTAMNGSSAPLDKTDWTPLRGKRVVIWPDNDDPGRDYAQAAADAIKAAGAYAVEILSPPPDKPEKWDAADCVKDGADPRDMLREMRRAAHEVEPAPFRVWTPIDASAIPPREFLYGHHYIRKFASVTVAPGGLGKSTLVLAECIMMATGCDCLGVEPKEPLRVVYYNAEDPLDEIQRRVIAICDHYDIPQDAFGDRFFVASGRDDDLILARGDEGEIVELTFQRVERFCEEWRPDVIVLDPLQNMTESPETNDVFRRLGKRLSLLADEADCSIEIVHHVRKLNGKAAEMEDSRGGSSLIGAVRAGRVLNPMTPEDAAKAGLETHIDHFRVDDGKANLARRAERAAWFRRLGVQIGNGDWVAVAEPWQWPDAFEGVTPDDAARARAGTS